MSWWQERQISDGLGFSSGVFISSPLQLVQSMAACLCGLAKKRDRVELWHSKHFSALA